MAVCPSKSPESNQPCRLPDDRHYHSHGHEGEHPSGYPGWSTVWPTTEEEQKRWCEMESRHG